MSDLITSKAAIAEAAKTTPRVRSANVALSRGGSYNIVTLRGQPPIAVVEDPDKLSEALVAEIEAGVTRERQRLAKNAPAPMTPAAPVIPAPTPTVPVPAPEPPTPPSIPTAPAS